MKENLKIIKNMEIKLYNNLSILVYSGKFYNDLKEGYGCEYINNKLIYESEFINNKYHGFGTLYEYNNENINIFVYIGNCNYGIKHGSGTIYKKCSNYYTKQLIFEGNFIDNKKMEKEHIILIMKKYCYRIVNDMAHGLCTEYDKLGNIVYEGEIRNNIKIDNK